MSGCPAGARNWHISYFSMLLHSKKPVYLGFSGKQNCSDTCVPEQFFPRCQNDQILHCLFSRQKTARVKHKAVFRAIRNVFSAKQLPEGIFWLRSFSRQMGIFQLARKVSAMVGSRAPKPSAASAGYRHETA